MVGEVLTLVHGVCAPQVRVKQYNVPCLLDNNHLKQGGITRTSISGWTSRLCINALLFPAKHPLQKRRNYGSNHVEACKSRFGISIRTMGRAARGSFGWFFIKFFGPLLMTFLGFGTLLCSTLLLPCRTLYAGSMAVIFGLDDCMLAQRPYRKPIHWFPSSISAPTTP